MRPSWLKSKKGFTLVELMVALAAASILSLAALQIYGMYLGAYKQQILRYQEESQALIREMQQVYPYKKSKENFSLQKSAGFLR